MARLHLRLGTRRSLLALAQSRNVARQLEEAHPGTSVELVEMTTRGDREKGDLAPLGGKGLFTQELEAGLADGSLDLAVHSLKDLPVQVPEELVVAAFPERADPRDVLICADGDLEGIPAGTTVLTGALRRRAQILRHRPDVTVEGLRGNVQTRLRKWRERPGSGVVLAAAGLDRLGIGGDLPVHPLSPDLLLPAPGQGTLAVQVKRGAPAEELCAVLDHPETAQAAAAERHVVAAFGGNCALPLAAWARIEEGEVRIAAFLATPNAEVWAEAEASGATPEEAARACVKLLEERGARDVLARIEGA